MRKIHKSNEIKRHVEYRPSSISDRETSLGQRHFFIEAVGVMKINEDGSDRQKILGRCRPGEVLLLVREASGIHDEGVIKIVRSNGDQIGFVAKSMADRIAQDMDWGYHFRAEISEITQGKGRKRVLGCNIKVTLV